MARISRILRTATSVAMAVGMTLRHGHAEEPAARKAPPLSREPPSVRLLLIDHGPEKVEGRHRLSATQCPGSRVIAKVLPADAELRGSVALFEVFARGRAELRRLPAQGQEDNAIVLCRVVEGAGPAEAAPGVDGRWRVVAKGADGSVNRLAWEWWTEGRALAGRFDPDTDYRFAHLERGSRDGGRVSFFVQYIQDRYEITGTSAGEGWAGSWRKVGEEGAGTWVAERAAPGMREGDSPAARRDEPVALNRWARKSDGAAWHGLEGEKPPGEGWVLDGQLGRAWRWKAGDP